MEDTLKDFWATRPRRPRRNRKVAGVAAGIGNRYGVDPVIIRVGFVVATFYGGAGILFYILGWLLLPEQDDEAAPFEAMVNNKRSSTSTAFTILLCLLLLPAFWFFVDNDFSGIFGVLLVGAALYLLHRNRGHLGRPRPDTAGATDGTAAGMTTGDMTGGTTVPYPATGASSGTPAGAGMPGGTAVPPPVAPETEPRPPAWDPLGAAPFAWDLPEPSQPEPESPAPPRRKSRVGLVTIGLALITAGSLAVVAPYSSWFNPQHVVGVVLGVLGLGLVAGSFLRGGRGLIGLAIPLSLIGIGLTVISPDGYHGLGEITERPATIADVRDDYRRSAGAVTLDLTQLPATGRVDTNVSVDVGDVTVIVPETADVDLTCSANAGDLDCLGRGSDGPSGEITATDLGPDGPGGLFIELDAKVGAGQVEVRRG